MNQKRIDLIVSVVAAIVLWFYVVYIVNPPVQTVLRDLPVNITGTEALEEKGLAPAFSQEHSATIIISGPRNSLNKIKAEDVILTVDVSELEEGTSPVEVRAELPQGISLVSIANATVDVDIEDLVSVSKPVDVTLTGGRDGREPTVLSSSLTQVEVSGAATQVDKVASIKVSGDLSGSDLDVPVDLTLAATPVDAEGKTVPGVKLAHDTLNVKAVIYQLKTVPLEIPVQGSVWEGAILKEQKISNTLVIKGPALSLSQISGIKSKPVDIEGIFESTTFDAEPVLPNGVFVADSADPPKAEFVIDENGELTFSFKPSQISVKNLGEGLEATVTLAGGAASVTAKVRGPVATLRTLAAGDIAPFVDASGRGEGDHNLTLSPSQNINGLTVNYSPEKAVVSIK